MRLANLERSTVCIFVVGSFESSFATCSAEIVLPFADLCVVGMFRIYSHSADGIFNDYLNEPSLFLPKHCIITLDPRT